MKNKRKTRILICTLTICAVILTGVTYSWFTVRESVENRFRSSNLNTEIYEIFDSQTAWKPDVPVQKEVGVINNGTSDALVRIRLSEFLMMLETGEQGVPSVTNLDGMTEADLTDPSAWEAENLAVRAAKYDDSGLTYMENENGFLYYKVSEILKSTNFGENQGRNPFISRYIKIGWRGADWVYNEDDGYHYYQKVLKSGESTSLLIDTVELSGNYPNMLQFAPYFLEAAHESVFATPQTAEQWGIDFSS